MTVSAKHHGRTAKLVREGKPTTFGEFPDEWWCESEFGDTVLMVACKLARFAAEEAADYFNSLAVDGPLDAIDVTVEGWEGLKHVYTVHRVTAWRAELL